VPFSAEEFPNGEEPRSLPVCWIRRRLAARRYALDAASWAMDSEYGSWSPLLHFDPAELLDVLSTGVLMLDAQLCVTYVNVAAEDLLAFSLYVSRGRPFGDFIRDAGALHKIFKRALETGEGIAGQELTFWPAAAPRAQRTLDITVTPVPGITGMHLLIELANTMQCRS